MESFLFSNSLAGSKESSPDAATGKLLLDDSTTYIGASSQSSGQTGASFQRYEMSTGGAHSAIALLRFDGNFYSNVYAPSGGMDAFSANKMVVYPGEDKVFAKVNTWDQYQGSFVAIYHIAVEAELTENIFFERGEGDEYTRKFSIYVTRESTGQAATVYLRFSYVFGYIR